MIKALLVDCMGTLTTTLSGQPFPQHSHDLQPLAGVTDAIAYFYRSGWKIIAHSNQDQINHPTTPQSLEAVQQQVVYTLQLFPAISKVYFSDWTGEYCWSVELDFSVQNKVQIIQTQYQRSDFLNLSRPGQQHYDSFRKPGAGMLRLALLQLTDDPQEVWVISNHAVDRDAAIAAKVNFCPTPTWLKRYKEF
ncbi:hypothetical protein VB834_25735 [Limnoraphis robusta Tam1]|uniref:Uncharacterized protein n=1 Tax=Limnoraphis robusta CCNP1315 TaxID=3110306 RepID=A0ABU5TRC2_9CYAN|nr:hypothetical protein [Limnoraphis robusta]MEA5498494.1 hypothetical protein [Limnoraphis robusta BA-68 BA1]MEA5517463.1 hypothetical protein [Limnoraphis robusta CCNP1315]MEA5542436.1 hypothetical protein [Limnoraphis robusta Tam1]MEA5548965.1 hypothetical protein [Limnoraphis robusta CCNP1324]